MGWLREGFEWVEVMWWLFQYYMKGRFSKIKTRFIYLPKQSRVFLENRFFVGFFNHAVRYRAAAFIHDLFTLCKQVEVVV